MKRILAILLTLCVLGGVLIVPAAAEDTPPDPGETVLTPEQVAEELTDQIGQTDTQRLVDELKKLLETTRAMSDEELSGEIRSIGEGLGIPLNDVQVDMLLDLYRQFEALSESELAQKIEDMKATVEKLRDFAEKAKETKETVDEYVDKASGFMAKLKELWDSLFGK